MLEAEFTLLSPEEVASLAPERARGLTHALTTAMGGAPEDLLARLPDLEVIVSCGAGQDRFDLAGLERSGIALRHTPDVVTTDTADMAVALLYAVARGLVAGDAFVRSGQWQKGRMAPSMRVAGKKAGVVGLGRIGRTVAERLQGAGLSVRYTGPREKREAPFVFEPDLLNLARWADFLVVCSPGGAETRHMISAAVLSALGAGGVLINVSRGSVVDEEALLAALETGGIAGAGLDVFDNEPDIDPRFLQLTNTVLQPHAAAMTADMRRDMIAEVCRLLQVARN
ncbi:NAD(P)-dependent oxidoreductase [Stappia indica]|uniref:NAD(P)-dependent oxidoreductase n=1 Tax=Stappia indica TaxID=538381 RepID=UPI001CD7B389|nr:NAD(P)-dependent oxidoreductase [Stappia indica]MCA1298797.1 2-hydroxyacid dehydrogenase [Stappia indica]